MKKFIIFSLAIILGLGTILVAPTLAEDENVSVTTTAATTSNKIQARELVGGMEKIPSPDKICLYNNVKRQGNDLYGVMKTETELAGMSATTCPVAAPFLEKFNKLPEKAQATAKKLEKIAAPWLLHQYEQIRKVGTALWGLKKETGDKNTNDNDGDDNDDKPKATSTVAMYVQPANAACVITAIKAKDTALVNNNASTTAALTAAITARTNCQEAALLATVTASSTASTTVLMNQQKTAMGLCTQAFRESFTIAKEAAKKAHVTIWENYRNSLRVCQPAATTTPALMIEDGGGSLF